jgi:formylglycine-generating enzyme required for sulfatase activity/tRNA A-37 threonylcarbamoyl transferase component Bud32
MNDRSMLNQLGLSDATDMIWTKTLEAIRRKGYEIKRLPGGDSAKIGEGTFASVFYAEHVQDKTPFAIKIFKDDEADKLASCKREAETLRAANFPRQFAVTAYDVWHEPGAQPFIVMEYIRGQPIDQFCRKQGLDRPRRIALAEDVLRGLQTLHRRNIQHRDISVANILIDGEGKVRYLDFGLAGEIVRALRHTTIDARGNRAYSPGEVVRGEKAADAKDDIYACGMLAFHVLTDDAPPENTTQSGDPQHLRECRKQLKDRGIEGTLARILLRSLSRPEHRFAQPDAMADALFDYRVRRPQRVRSRWIAAAVLLIAVCLGAVGWWRVEQLRQDSAFREYTALQGQVKDLPYAEHDAVAQRLDQARQLGQQRKQEYDAGQRDEELATLRREMEILRQAIRISTGLARLLPRLEALGIPLNETPWVDQSPVIVRRQSELARQYQDINGLLADGRIDEADESIQRLQLALVQLIRDNTDAGAATATRGQFQTLAANVPPRLKNHDGMTAFSRMAELAEQAWEEGDWKQTGLLFGQAMQDLNQWLETNETVEERTARTKASEERIAALETEQGRLRGEVNRIAAERDKREQRVQELENKIADITLERVNTLDELKTKAEVLKSETGKRTAAEKLAQQREQLNQQLTAEKAALEQQNAQLQEQVAALDRLNTELAEAKQQAKTLADRLAAAETETARWRQIAQSQPAPAEKTPPATTPEAPPARPPAIAATALATRTNSIGMELIRIPAGKFQRGARDGEPGAKDDEKPRHWVQISNPFDTGKYPVTQGQYTKVMGHNPSYFSSTGRGSDKVHWMDTTDFPVESVSFYDTLEFCNKLSALEKLNPYYQLTNVQRHGQTITSATVKILGGNGCRLLTEAEWEYIARAGTDSAFPWGDTLSSTQANFEGEKPYGAANGRYLERTSEVGSYSLNAWGLGDTAGNVWEWVWDWYGEQEYQQYANKTAVDPTGPSTGTSRVIRGGGWNCMREICRSASRYYAPGAGRSLRFFNRGFRVAQGQSSE